MSKHRQVPVRLVLGSLVGVVVSVGSHTPSVQAHEQAIAFTEVTFLPNTPNGDCQVDGCGIEVAHRLVIHDAEHALENIDGVRSDLVGDASTQARMDSYVAENFGLFDPETGNLLELKLLGGEVERGYYWVYQEGRLPTGHDTVLLSQTVLLDVISTQTNRVNVVYKDRVDTLIFNQSNTPQGYVFDD